MLSETILCHRNQSLPPKTEIVCSRGRGRSVPVATRRLGRGQARGEQPNSDTWCVPGRRQSLFSGSSRGRVSVAGPLTQGTGRNEIIPVIRARLYGFLCFFNPASPDIYRATKISRPSSPSDQSPLGFVVASVTD